MKRLELSITKNTFIRPITFFFLLGAFCSLNLLAQTTPPEDLPNPFEASEKYLKQNNYITPILELKANEDKYLASPKWKNPFLERMIMLEGYVGNYDEAYRYENILLENSPSTKKLRQNLSNDLTASPLGDYKMLDALDAIENAAANRQVVMINEEHRTPFHRAITLQLLSRLYAKGFRYFAAETLSVDLLNSKEDTELNKRQYPTQQTGYYTADPIYADAIRTALKLGYKVVPYESIDIDCQPTNENPEVCNDKRERGQAQNLYDRILKNDQQAKILVHVGRAHNVKNFVSKDFNFMAYYFKQLTKIDPLTIDQLRFSERFNTADEQPLYRYLTKNNLLQKPTVYQAADGSLYHGVSITDIAIFHPRMRYENGRPTFLKMNGLRKAALINLKKLKLPEKKNLFSGAEPVLIQAFYAQESADAVPIDQIILYPGKAIPALILPKGKFRIRTMDKTGNVLNQKVVKL